MTDEPKFSVVPLTPRQPAPRQADPRDELIVNMHKLAMLADKQLEHWEFWGQHMATMIALALLLAEREQWADLHEFLKTAADQSAQMAASKTRIASDLPPGLSG